MKHPRWCNTQTCSEVYNHTQEWAVYDWQLRYTSMSVHWFINVCNISMYLSFVTQLPEDGHMSGRNMQVVYGVYNIHSYTYVHLFFI